MFTTERELVETLKHNYRSICDWRIQKKHTCILEEVDLGFGVADLVISKLYKPKSTALTLSYFDILIYKIIESDQHVSIELLKNVTRAKEAQIRKSIDILVCEKYVNEVQSFFRINKNYKTITSKTIAIEAKLKNWKRALEQAFRYKWFATQSYVVLDAKYIAPALKNISSFAQSNVGLACINLNGEITIIHKPVEEKPIDDKMNMLLNEYIRSALSRQ